MGGAASAAYQPMTELQALLVSSHLCYAGALTAVPSLVTGCALVNEQVCHVFPLVVGTVLRVAVIAVVFHMNTLQALLRIDEAGGCLGVHIMNSCSC
jgi:hypothetical protein